MSRSFTKINIHGIFSTKNRARWIRPDIEKMLYDKINDILANELGCRVHIINGDTDHIHILFSLNPVHSVSDIFKKIKGASSYFINEKDVIKDKFLWQTGFAAFSVSESQFKKVFEYIRNQKEHHKKLTSEQEIQGFLKNHGFGDVIINR
jgi:putative transposase